MSKRIVKYRIIRQLSIHIGSVLFQIGLFCGDGINGCYWHLIPNISIVIPDDKGWQDFHWRFIQLLFRWFCLELKFGIFFEEKKYAKDKTFSYWKVKDKR